LILLIFNLLFTPGGTTIVLLLYALSLILAICLLVGIIKKRHNLILPWLICTVIGIVSGIILIIFLVTSHNLNDSNNILIVFFIAILLGYALGIYFWLVVFAIYKKFKAQNTHPEFQTKNFDVNYSFFPNTTQYPADTTAAQYSTKINPV